MNVRTLVLSFAIALSLTNCATPGSDGPASNSSPGDGSAPAQPASTAPKRELTAPPADRGGVLAPDTGVPVGQRAIPSLFLIDRSGGVRWAHSDPDFKVGPATEQILAALDAVAPPAK